MPALIPSPNETNQRWTENPSRPNNNNNEVSAVADRVVWAGTEFSVHAMDGEWNDVPGIYIFAAVESGFWNPKYIGQCDSFKNRCPVHERWEEARRLGATHVHAAVVRDPAQRSQLEQTLIRAHQPPLNSQFR
jgi:hypothetical protein